MPNIFNCKSWKKGLKSRALLSENPVFPEQLISLLVYIEEAMPSVRVKDNEPFEVAMRRFKRSCEKAGILAEVRRREFYEKPTWERKRKAAAAVKRWQKKISRETRRFDRAY